MTRRAIATKAAPASPTPGPSPVKTLALGSRPSAPRGLGDLDPHTFKPCPNMSRWVRHVFLREDGILYNPEHSHLEFANLGFVWTNIPNRHQQRWLVASAEIPIVQGGAWKRGRFDQQLRDWFGTEPDFLITLYAPVLSGLGDRDFCAVIEHELYHCAQATTDLGAPRFHRDGSPIYGIRGHDVEEFVGVVQRYGARGDVAAIAKAATLAPRISDALLTAACGTCGGKV